MGDPLSEEELRISYAKGELPRIYRMDFNKNHRLAKQQNGSQNSLEMEETKSHLSSTTTLEKKSILSSADATSQESQKSLPNIWDNKSNFGRDNNKISLEAKSNKSLLSKLKNVSKLIIPSKILQKNILPSRLRQKN